MDVDARALYVISVAAELAGVHPQTLRIYERKGLLSPARTSGRSRRYSDRDIALLRRIQDLTNDGVSLAGVQRILALENDLAIARARIAEVEARLDALQREAEQQVEAAHRQYRRDLVPVRSTVVARFEAHGEGQRTRESQPWP
jgi:MerR family transcriptional regulator, heat shock protein HspR